MTEPTMPEKFAHNAELAIRTLRDQCGVTLGYDEKSVVWLDGYIERLRGGIDPEFKDSLVGVFGSYLGECIRRRFGGRWDETDGRWASVSTRRTPPSAPGRQTVRARPQDSIAAFYRAIRLSSSRHKCDNDGWLNRLHEGRSSTTAISPSCSLRSPARGPDAARAVPAPGHGRRQARVTPGDKGRPAGEIVRCCSARLSIGVLRQRAERWIAIPEEADERDAIRVLGFLNGITPRDGEVVVVTITQWPTLKEAAGGQVSEALGMPGEAGVRMRAVLRTRDLPEAFPKEVLEESCAFPDAVPPEMWEGRLDLRNAAVFTIDGADAKDFDDAVSLEVVNPHIMRLGVHIADVSHYVKKGTALDAEAAQRPPVYLADHAHATTSCRFLRCRCRVPDPVSLMDVDAGGRVLVALSRRPSSAAGLHLRRSSPLKGKRPERGRRSMRPSCG